MLIVGCLLLGTTTNKQQLTNNKYLLTMTTQGIPFLWVVIFLLDIWMIGRVLTTNFVIYQF